MKSVLNIHWKDWCWKWSSNTLVTWCEELLIGKDPDAGKDWRQEEKGMTKEMVGWHRWLNGHEFEHALGVGDGRGSLACYSLWDCRVRHDWVTELNWLNLDMRSSSRSVGRDRCSKGDQKRESRDFLVVWWLRLLLPLKEARVPSLGELRSHLPGGVAKRFFKK